MRPAEPVLLALLWVAVPAATSTAPPEGSLIDLSGFAFRRVVPDGPQGLTDLRLDAAALAKSRLTDLRVVTADGHQVPYLLDRLDAPMAIELTPPRRISSGPPATGAPPAGSYSAYLVTFPAPGLPAAELVLDTPARVFARRLRLVVERASADGRDARPFRAVAEATWSHSDPDTPAPVLSLSLPRGMPAMAWLLVDEGDNAPLALGRLRLLLPAYRLRFFRETSDRLWLVYGNPAAAAPRYDLALLAPRLAGEEGREVWPGPERTVPSPRTGFFTSARVFWAALVCAVAVLLFLLARLLRA